MTGDFEFILERPDGKPIALQVADKGVSLTIPPPVTPGEKDAVSGLGELAKALKKEPQTAVTDAGATITIATGERDPALGIIVAQILAANGIVKQDAPTHLKDAIDTAMPPPPPPAQAMPSLEDITLAMKEKVQPAPSENLAVANGLPAAERGHGVGGIA